MNIPKEVLDYCIKHNYTFNYSFTPNENKHYFYIDDGLDVYDQGIDTTQEKAMAYFMDDFTRRRLKYRD